MFSIENLNSKQFTTIKVYYKGDAIEFIITHTIGKRNKDELGSENLFKILNSYLDYKGDEFKAHLFKTLQQSYYDIRFKYMNQNIRNMPLEIVHPVLDIMDPEDVFYYIKNIFKLQAPDILKDEYDSLIETDGRGTRVQTYLKEDYLQLATLSTILKVAFAPIFEFVYTKSAMLVVNRLDYTLFDFIRTHKIFKYPAMVKLKGFVAKLLEQPDTIIADEVRILDKQIPKYDMVVYGLAIVVIQKLIITSFIGESGQNNIVNNIYCYGNNKLKETTDVSNTLRNKSPKSGGDGLDGPDNESILEQFRQLSDIPYGDQVVMNYFVSSTKIIYDKLPLSMKRRIDVNDINRSYDFCKAFLQGRISEPQLSMLGIIFKPIQNPMNIEYLGIEQIVNLLAVGFAYLRGCGFKHLALLLTSQAIQSTDNTMSINSSVNRTRIPVETKKELDILFPLKRKVNDNLMINIVEEWVNEITSEFNKFSWFPYAYDEYIVDAVGKKEKILFLPTELRCDIANFLISHENIIMETA